MCSGRGAPTFSTDSIAITMAESIFSLISLSKFFACVLEMMIREVPFRFNFRNTSDSAKQFR